MSGRFPESNAGPTEDSGGTVASRVIARRKQLVRTFRRDRNVSADGFARTLGVSTSTVLAIIGERTDRFTWDRQRMLLTALGVSRDEWYRER